MIIKELKYYLKNEMSLEEIQSNILEKINKKCDATTGYIAHVYDSSALKYYVVISDNIVESYKLNKNILVYNDFKISYDRLDKVEEDLNINQSDINNKKDELSSQETLKGQLEQEISQLDRDIEEATNRSEDTTELERQKAEKERELANLTQNITDITNEINNLEQIRNDLLTQKDNIEKELEDYKLATKELIDNLKANLDSKSSELNSRIDSVNSNLTNIINTKANQDTTYTKDETYNKTEVDDLVNTKANADAVVNLTSDQTIEGVKTFSMVPVVATQPTDDNQLANKAYVDSKSSEITRLTDAIATKANTDAVVNLTDDQTIEGVKTFSMVPIVATQPTNANQVANKAYVDSVTGMPDYNAGIEISKTETGTYKAPKRGLFVITVAAVAALKLYVNNILISQMTSGGGYVFIEAEILVDKNDIIKWQGAKPGVLKFFPLKGAK